MSDFETVLAEHQAKHPGCTDVRSGRCKCGNSRVYVCMPHDDLWAFSEPGCTCVWVGK